jgi:hypothetical protein
MWIEVNIHASKQGLKCEKYYHGAMVWRGPGIVCMALVDSYVRHFASRPQGTLKICLLPHVSAISPREAKGVFGSTS